MKLINKTDPFDKHSENKTDEVHASNGSHGKKRIHILHSGQCFPSLAILKFSETNCKVKPLNVAKYMVRLFFLLVVIAVGKIYSTKKLK